MSALDPLPQEFFTDEARYLLDQSAITERKYVAAMQERQRQLDADQAQSKAAAEAIMRASREAENRSEFELRAALAQSIQDYDDALIKVATAESNVQRAADRMRDVDAELADYSDLDSQIQEWQVDQIRRNAHDPLPFALANARRDRGNVIDTVDAHHKAYDRLQLELQIAQGHLAACVLQRSRCAAHVVARSMDDTASELNRLLDAAENHRRALHSAAATWLSTSDGAVALQLSTRSREALWRPLLDMQPEPTIVESLRSWHSKLEQDAAATLDQSNEPA